MSTQRLLGTITAALAWTALIVQLGINVAKGASAEAGPVAGIGMSLVNYFGYFTILTNLLVALVLTVPAVAPAGRAGRFFSDLRTTWTASAGIVVVGVAYHLLLSAIYNPTGVEALTDLAFHYIVPVLYAAYWVAFTDVREARWTRQVGALSVYPTAYFAYLVVRGQLIGTYPYFFVDVREIGLLAAFRNAVGILVCYLVVAWVIALLARRFTGTRASA
ncbi:MAG: hypothetical protein RL139_459 [Gemmatimonadota bacterium]|jgi:hypothetical protein